MGGAGGNVAVGISKAYKLPEYKAEGSICINQINIKDSDIGNANFSNIKQNNNCGSAGAPKVKARPSKKGIVKDNKRLVNKKRQEREVNAAKRRAEEKAKADKLAAEQAARL